MAKRNAGQQQWVERRKIMTVETREYDAKTHKWKKGPKQLKPPKHRVYSGLKWQRVMLFNTLFRGRMTLKAQALLHYLLRRMGKLCTWYGSQWQICDDIGCSRFTVSKATRELVLFDIIKILDPPPRKPPLHPDLRRRDVQGRNQNRV